MVFQKSYLSSECPGVAGNLLPQLSIAACLWIGIWMQNNTQIKGGPCSTLSFISPYIYFFFFSEKENRPFKPNIGQTTPWLLSLQLADLLRPLCSTTIFPVSQYPNIPNCGGAWTRSGCDAACELRTVDEPHRGPGSSICKQAIFAILSPEEVSVSRISPDILCQSTPTPSQSLTKHSDQNTSCPLLCYQSSSDSPLPPFPLEEITQDIVNSSSIACGTTTLHQRTRIWPFFFPNTRE